MVKREWDYEKGRVHHFSGGRSSAYMVLKWYTKGDIVIFCDTGRETEETYQFICDFAENTGIDVIWVTYKGGWNRLIERETALPNQSWRKCTIEMKVRAARRYLRSMGIFKYRQCIGFRMDEEQRVRDYKEQWQQVVTEFPLYENGIGADEIYASWEKVLWALRIPPILSNCDGCFMKGKMALIMIYSVMPWLAEKWIKDEIVRGNGRTFIKGVSHFQLFEIAGKTKYYYEDLWKVKSAYTCSCTA